MAHFGLGDIVNLSAEDYRQDFYDKIKDSTQNILEGYKEKIRKLDNRQVTPEMAKELAYKIAGAYADVLKKEKLLHYEKDFSDESSFNGLSLEDRSRILDALRTNLGIDINTIKSSFENQKIEDHLEFVNQYSNQFVEHAKKKHDNKVATYLGERLHEDRDATIKGINNELSGYKISDKAAKTIKEDKLYGILKAGKAGAISDKAATDNYKGTLVATDDYKYQKTG